MESLRELVTSGPLDITTGVEEPGFGGQASGGGHHTRGIAGLRHDGNTGAMDTETGPEDGSTVTIRTIDAGGSGYKRS